MIINTKLKSNNKLERISRGRMLAPTKVEWSNYAINFVKGCSHGCNYCYAMKESIERWHESNDCNDWMKPKLVENTLDLLDKEIPKLKSKIESVTLCFTTDPFMYHQPEVIEMALKIITRLNRDDIPCIVLTKGLLPKELATKEMFNTINTYGITLVSLDQKFCEKFESGSAPLKERLSALRYLHDKGLKTLVSIEPWPTPMMIEQDLNEVLESVKFVNKIIFGRIHHNPAATKYLKKDPSYYTRCVKTVKEFCAINNIECHIKKGTK